MTGRTLSQQVQARCLIESATPVRLEIVQITKRRGVAPWAKCIRTCRKRNGTQIQFVSATLVLGWLVLDITLPSSRYQASLGVSRPRTFMGGVVDLVDDGLQVRSTRTSAKLGNTSAPAAGGPSHVTTVRLSTSPGKDADISDTSTSPRPHRKAGRPANVRN